MASVRIVRDQRNLHGDRGGPGVQDAARPGCFGIGRQRGAEELRRQREAGESQEDSKRGHRNGRFHANLLRVMVEPVHVAREWAPPSPAEHLALAAVSVYTLFIPPGTRVTG